MNSIAYNSVDMAGKGEGYDYALQAVKRMAEMRPIRYYYDIVCRHDQLKVAGEMLPRIYEWIREYNPHLTDAEITVGITTDSEFRPAGVAAAAWVKRNASGVEMIDLHPERG